MKNSAFWIPKINLSKISSLTDWDKLSISELIALSQIRTHISKYVHILTRKNIPVEFLSNIHSNTDGERVYITSEITNGNIDSIVGLSLHEASHIMISDFKLLENLKSLIPRIVFSASEKKNISIDKCIYTIKSLLNWIEDRRVDNYICERMPGYVVYYNAMYDRYFNDPEISEALKSEEYLEETLDNYLYRIFNFLNPNTDVNALKKLGEIYDIIDLKSISRLHDSMDSFNVALKVYEIIIDVIEKEKEPEKNEDKKESLGGGGKAGDSDSNGSQGSEKSDEFDQSKDDEFSDKIKDIFEKQKDFLNGKVEKTSFSENIIKKINSIQQSGAEIKEVKITSDEYSYFRINEHSESKHNVIVFKKVPDIITMENKFDFFSRFASHESAVNEGIQLGIQLGRKLTFRNEKTSLKYTRRNSGKIDKRIIGEIGYNDAIFQNTIMMEYKDVILYISIDNSVSMGGEALYQSIKMVTAICKAASLTNHGIDVVVSLRGTISIDPYIAIIYDSRVDSFNKVKNIFPHIITCGGTPEGLCISAIQDSILKTTDRNISYFLNISDGEPAINGYSGKPAAEHTRGEIIKMRKKGIRILSYFVSNDQYDDLFKIMYGKDARFINVSNVVEVARTLNNLFLIKE